MIWLEHPDDLIVGWLPSFFLVFALNYSWFSVYWSCFHFDGILFSHFTSMRNCQCVGMLIRLSALKSNCLGERKVCLEFFLFFTPVRLPFHCSTLKNWFRDAFGSSKRGFHRGLGGFFSRSQNTWTQVYIELFHGSMRSILKSSSLWLRPLVLWSVCKGSCVCVFDL